MQHLKSDYTSSNLQFNFCQQLNAGESFGSLKGSAAEDHLIKSNYPMFYTNEKCILLKIPQFDYQRVVQVSHFTATTKI